MNQKQMEAAKKSLSEWLEHPQELGKKPAKIEYAGEFDLHELHYYIFKYKKTLLGSWLLGVCGGYEGDALEHCGHVFSEMQEYVKERATQDAVKIVEMIRTFWMEQAKKQEEQKDKKRQSVNFVLLKENVWDKERFLQELAKDWQIADETPKKDAAKNDPDTALISYNGAIVTVGLMPAPIPNGEAEYHAKLNFMWKEAVEVTNTHQAHLIVAVLGAVAPTEAGKLLVKVVSTLCKDENVIGIYANQVVYEPKYYQSLSQMMKEDLFPVYNLVWFGLYRGEKGMCAYTSGLQCFGKDEMEILDSSHSPNELMGLLANMSGYVIEGDVTLKDGETVGYTAEQKLPVTRSQGVAVQGMSLKIAF